MATEYPNLIRALVDESGQAHDELDIEQIESLGNDFLRSQNEAGDGVYGGWLGDAFKAAGQWIAGAVKDIGEALGKLLTTVGGKAVVKALCVAFGTATGTGPAGAAACTAIGNEVAKLLVTAGEKGSAPPAESSVEHAGHTYAKVGRGWLLKKQRESWESAAAEGRIFFWQPGMASWVNSQVFPAAALELDRKGAE